MVAKEYWSSSEKEALKVMLHHKVDYWSSLSLLRVRLDLIASLHEIPIVKVTDNYKLCILMGSPFIFQSFAYEF